MNIIEVKPNVFVFDNDGPGSNLSFVKTPEGVVMIDTGMHAEDTREILETAQIDPAAVKMVINTHSDPDHVGGNSLFDCPVMAHELTYERMKSAGRKANELPTQVFREPTTMQFGGEIFVLEHKGGHKPDEIVVWMPEKKVLFTGDLVFEGRYPYMKGGANVLEWIRILKELPGYKAEVIVPGHGTLTDVEYINSLRDYFQNTWDRAVELYQAGKPKKEILKDADFLEVDSWDVEKMRRVNIEVILEQVIESLEEDKQGE